MAFLSIKQLNDIGFKAIGKGVLISERASIYGAKNISIGDFSRIDDFVILSASECEFIIGCYVHISCYSSLIGHEKIEIDDYSNISGRTLIYSSSDDFSGIAMTGPLVGTAYTNVKHAPVFIGKHTIVGAGSIVLPGVIINEGVAVGAMSLIVNDCQAFTIYAGIPARSISKRSEALLNLEQKFLQSSDSNNL